MKKILMSTHPLDNTCSSASLLTKFVLKRCYWFSLNDKSEFSLNFVFQALYPIDSQKITLISAEKAKLRVIHPNPSPTCICLYCPFVGLKKRLFLGKLISSAILLKPFIPSSSEIPNVSNHFLLSSTSFPTCLDASHLRERQRLRGKLFPLDGISFLL